MENNQYFQQTEHQIEMVNKPSSVHVYAICYNEILLIPMFYAHYKKRMGVDKITILDNYSTDGSDNLARSLGMEVINYDSNNQIRDDIYLQIKNNVWKNSDCEWVIVCDIDELLDYSKVDFSKDFHLVRSKGYNMLGYSDHGVYSKDYSKILMFKRANVFEMNYNFGCHQCTPAGTDGVKSGFNVLKYSEEFATLFHYCYLSEEYVIQRRKMFAERLSDFNKEKGFGHQYLVNDAESVKKIFDELRSQANVVLL